MLKMRRAVTPYQCNVKHVCILFITEIFVVSWVVHLFRYSWQRFIKMIVHTTLKLTRFSTPSSSIRLECFARLLQLRFPALFFAIQYVPINILFVA